MTWASNAGADDRCLGSASLLAFNGYPAWYDDYGNTSAPAAFWRGLGAWAAEHYPGVPVVISETGAGGIYEFDNATAVKWSTKYQTEVLAADVDVALSDDAFSGLTLWHHFDFKANDGAQCGPCETVPDVSPPLCAFINLTTACDKGKRPGGANHKGVLDFYRRPKPAFAAVASRFFAARRRQ